MTMAVVADHPLYKAIRENNFAEFRSILRRSSNTSDGVVTSSIGADEQSPLACACTHARGEMVLSLMRFASENDIRYAFPIAVRHKSGNVDMVREFIKFGMNVNSVWSEGVGGWSCFTTPLLGAVRMGNYELVKYLIENKADINPLDPEGEIFILKTAMSSYDAHVDGEPDILKLLIRNGADVNENKGETLFSIFDNAMYNYRWEEIFDLCIDHGAKLDMHPYMYFACKVGHIDTVKYLIARGLRSDKEARYNGHIALHIAGCDGQKESSIVAQLLQWGSDPNSQVTPVGDDLYDTFLVGFSALHYACSQGDLEKLELLLDYDADVSCVNCSNVTVLFQLLDAVCKDKYLYEYMVLSSKRFEKTCSESEINTIKSKAECQLERYTKMTKLLIASGAKLIEDEWLIDYNKPYVVMSVDVLEGSSEFLLRTRSLIEYVKISLKNPSTLTELCRKTIRKLLPPNKSESVVRLAGTLPHTLLSLLLFEDILL